MIQELTRLKNLRNKVIDIEIQLGMIESDLLAVEKDLLFLENMYYGLKENIETLRSEGIIVVASEYKKIIQEFITVKKNLAFYNNLHSTLLGKFDKYRDLRDVAMVEYEEYRKFFDSLDNLIPFDPSKRKK